MTQTVPERFIRQADIVPADKLAPLRITVVGVGAIGRQVALQLAAMGVQHLQLIDFDTVEVGNLAAQGFLEDDLGKPKVEAVGDLCQELNSELDLITVNGRYTIDIDVGDVVFSCVDKMEARDFIHCNVSKKVGLFIDGRMLAEVSRVISAYNDATHEYYRTTLFSDIEAAPVRCTAKTTIYCSNVVAGMMISQFTKWLRGIEPPCDVTFNLLASMFLSYPTPEAAQAQQGGFDEDSGS